MEALRQRLAAERESKRNGDGQGHIEQREERDLLSAGMAAPGSGISVMDKLNMVDELKNVLRNRKQAAIRRFQEKKRRKDVVDGDEAEDGGDGVAERKQEEEGGDSDDGAMNGDDDGMEVA